MVTKPARSSGSGKFATRHMALHKFSILLVVTVPFLATVLAAWQTWNWLIGWHEVALLLATFIPIAAGITVGFHRYFTHNSFQCRRPVKIALGILGSMAIEGPIIRWVADHRMHHQLSDTENDLHSPVEGLWHSHIGWLFSSKTADANRYAPDLLADQQVMQLSNLFWLWAIVSVAFPLVFHSFTLFLWGSLVRIFLVHHFTWSVNSLCHTFGAQPYRTGDCSTNLAVLAPFTLGESFHNNHHAFPWSARHGHHWWQDISYMVIWTLAACNLAWKVRLPTAEQLIHKRNTRLEKAA